MTDTPLHVYLLTDPHWDYDMMTEVVVLALDAKDARRQARRAAGPKPSQDRDRWLDPKRTTVRRIPMTCPRLVLKSVHFG